MQVQSGTELQLVLAVPGDLRPAAAPFMMLQVRACACVPCRAGWLACLLASL